MSLHEMPDNELDDLFKKSLEGMNVPFREEDWAQMEQTLNAPANGKKPVSWRRFGLLALAVLFSGMIGWYGYSVIDTSDAPGILAEPSSQKPLSRTLRPDTRTDDAAAGKTKPGLKTKKSNASSNTAEEPVLAVTPENDSDTDDSDTQVNKRTRSVSPVGAPVNYRARKEWLANFHPRRQPLVKPTDKMIAPKAVQPEKIYVSQRAIKTGKTKLGFTESAGNQMNKNGIQKNTPDSPETYPGRQSAPNGNQLNQLGTVSGENPITQRLTFNSLALPAIRLPENERLFRLRSFPRVHASDSLRPIARRRPSFGIALVVSPDISSVGFRNLTRPGTNVGIMLEYRFANRWRIITGALRGTKEYDATAKDYTAWANYWSYRPTPYAINASCNVFDIPINLRYDWAQGKKYNLFASTGLSSYIMQKEEYWYKYEAPYDPSLSTYRQVKNENTHYFSVYNFSIGYERQLGSRLSWQVEPFVKVPLAGVGAGAIKLVSTGVFVSITYNITKL